MPPPIDLVEARRFAVDVVRRLREAGFEALWAGGCVRDQVRGQIPKDYDVATSATPEQVRALFGRRKTLAIGAAFGVIAVIGSRGSGTIEVATFRRDAAYSDGRHPDAVEFSTAVEDAQRRDFTINGLFYDPLAEKLIDYVGGEADLKLGIVRAIGNPHDRFAEDKLRMLRAVRFAVTFDFALETETFAAIKAHAPEIVIVSAERVAAEMRRMFVHPRRSEALRLLHRTELLHEVWPEAASIGPATETAPPPKTWQQSLALLDALSDPDFALALAAVMRQALPDATHAERAEAVERVGRRWRLSGRECRLAEWVLAHEDAVRTAAALPWSRVQPLLVERHAAELLQFAEAVAIVEQANRDGIEFCRAKLALPADVLDPAPLVTGNDLKSAGLRPGPDFKKLIEGIRRAQLDGEIKNQEEALALAATLLAGGVSETGGT